MAIDRLLMIQPDTTQGDLAFIRGMGQLRMPEGLSVLTVTPDFHTVGEVDWEVMIGFPDRE